MRSAVTRVTARVLNFADSATEGERQLTTARENQTAGLTNGRAANWIPEVAFSPFRVLSRRQLTFSFCWGTGTGKTKTLKFP